MHSPTDTIADVANLRLRQCSYWTDVTQGYNETDLRKEIPIVTSELRTINSSRRRMTQLRSSHCTKKSATAEKVVGFIFASKSNIRRVDVGLEYR